MRPIDLSCFFLVAVLSFAETNAQPGWYQQNPLPTGNNLKAVKFTNASCGIAVGELGTILRTTNGGATWTNQSTGTISSLNGIFFTDLNTAFVVGDEGTILFTTDEGATWATRTSGTTTSLMAVYFTNSNNGFAVGGEWGSGGLVLRTTDGGNTWTSTPSGTVCPLDGVAFADANIGTAVGDAGLSRGVVRTTNGGLSWTLLTDGPSCGTGVCFADAKHGTIVGCRGSSPSGLIWHTTDAGATWASQSSGTTKSLVGVCFSDSNKGSAVGYGVVLQTTNGGVTWVDRSAGQVALEAISFADTAVGTAVGQIGAILRTTDGGVTWNSQSRSAETAIYTYYGVSSISATISVAVGGRSVGRSSAIPTYSILRTDNGGESWTSQPAGEWRGILYGVCFTDENTGTAVGTRANSGTGAVGDNIMRTTNGGVSWIDQSTGIPVPLYGVFFSDANTGTVVGGKYDSENNPYGTILRTTNGGTTWTPYPYAIAYPLYGVCFTGTQNGVAVGEHGTILRTTDGGLSWTRKSSGTTADLHAVSFVGGRVGIAVGSYFDDSTNLRGTILRTTDGGDSWNVQMSGMLGALNGISFADGNTGIAVGGETENYAVAGAGKSLYGLVCRTTDGGITWVVWRSEGTPHLHDVSFKGPYNGVAVGAGGTILRTSTGGVTWVKDGGSRALGIPTECVLDQNCPNPFNPTTTIRFTIAGVVALSGSEGPATKVRLIVYDLLGREVAVLIDEQKAPGRYQVAFDGSKFSSGVYFYRLNAGDYVETKRMVLVR
jgi:photosystem II stability/assembly factor-like uncharacterized protein